MANEKFNVVGANIAEKATMIWNVADMLRGPFKPHEYGLVILPMTVVKRFHDCLLPTHDAVLAQYEKVKNFAVIDGFLTKTSGYQFYNTSKYTFTSLLADPENIESNFRDYLSGFSANVQDVLSKFDFDNIIKRMVESNTLYLVIKEFNSQKGYLGPDKISAVDCGYIFEDLVKRFSESYDEEAGAHFTSRDIIYMMTDLLLSDADLSRGGNVTVYDMTMGTSQMLSCMEERIHELNSNIDVSCFGQEFNPSTFAIAKADMMIRGGDPNNMRFGDTLSDDQFEGYQFEYIISNPPFGIDWKREQKAVEAEAAKGELGRFAPGLPKVSDGQQLFVLNGISKLSAKGKMAIIQNATPLSNGDAESGPAEIRRYILENDLLDAIVQLSPNQFMNAEIATYIWIISKNKPAYRAGKVQLIDASSCFVQRRKPIGKKKNDITDECRGLIVKAYGEYENKKYDGSNGIYCESKIIDIQEFGFYKAVVERPLYDEQGKIVYKSKKIVPDSNLRSIEIIPLKEDLDDYYNREIHNRLPDAWIDKSKTKIYYEILFGKIFYQPAIFDDSVGLLGAIHELDEREILLSKEISKQFVLIESLASHEDGDMVETGIEWFPKIPSTWQLVKGKYILELLKRPVEDGDGVITCFRDGEVTLRSNRREDGFTFADKEIGYQGVEPGDLVIHGMDGFAGAIGISDSRGKGSPVLNVCSVKDGYDKTYIMWYLRYLAYQNVFMATSTGIRERSCDLRWNKIANLEFVIPPINEQEKIVSIISEVFSPVDELLQIKATKDDLFKRYRKALVAELISGQRRIE